MGGCNVRHGAARCRACLVTMLGAVALATGAGTVWAARPLAGTVLVVNRSPAQVEFRVAALGGRMLTLTLAPFDLVPLPVTGVVPLEFQAGSIVRRYRLVPPGVYYFAKDKQGRLDLGQIGLQPADGQARPQPPAGVVDPEKLAALGTITVKLLVDNSEISRRQVWEPRLRQRMAAASEILKQTCRLQLQIVAVDTWKSDDHTTDFEKTLQEFERKVRPEPAVLAIGFTSRYPVHPGKEKLGGTRSPLHPYILIREHGPDTIERERLEVLVHELGHYLGAAHSPEADSVMRPDLADKKAYLRAFRILFDPINALALNLVSQQWRFSGVRRLDELDGPTRAALSDIYTLLAAASPGDPVAGEYLNLVRSPAAFRPAPPVAVVVRALVAADREQMRSGSSGELPGPTADELTRQYFRSAAGAAVNLPEKSAGDAFLFGLSLVLAHQPALNREIQLTLPPESGGTNSIPGTEIAGRPGMRNRTDLLQRFVAAAAYARLAGAPATEAAALARQADRMVHGPGLSFVELAADLAGIRFAQAIGEGKLRLSELADRFSVERFLPPLDGLKENLSADAFGAKFGSVYDARCQAELARIKQRINDLPAYRDAP